MQLPSGFIVRDPFGGRYVVEGLLGRGGFSAVYLVRDRQHEHKTFALKEIVDPSSRERERFLFEWEVLKRLHHRSLPQVYHVFENASLKRIFILMGYIEGYDLEFLRKEFPDKRFSLPLVLALLDPVVDAITYLHNQNPPIVHRDIKPANIVVPIGGSVAVLVDFSIAKEYVPNGTTTAIRHGSPGYAAPEQYTTGTNPRTDIYGLGATIYTLLTGIIPLDAITRLTSYRPGDPLKPVHELVPTIPLGVSQAVARAMHPNSDERFATIDAFWQEICLRSNEKKASSSEITSLSMPQHAEVSIRTFEDPSTDVSREGRAISPIPRRASPWQVFGVILALFFILGGTPLAFMLLHNRAAPSIPHPVTSPTTVATGQATALPTHPALSPIYPALNPAYLGQVSDFMTKKSTNMYLTNVQENPRTGGISGAFQGLGMTGPFNGTVTKAGHVDFTVTIYGGSSTLVFDGDIQISGPMAGSFQADTNGQRTGEWGMWTANPSS